MDALFPVSSMLPRMATTQTHISMSMDRIKMAKYPVIRAQSNKTHCTLRSYLTRKSTNPSMIVLQQKTDVMHS